jgi:hypothetical protein
MLDILNEKPIPLSKAARLFPSSNDEGTIHISTIHRWRTNGVRGVKLDAAMMGGRWVTTVEEIQRFIDRLSNQKTGTPSPARVRSESVARARRALASSGF